MNTSVINFLRKTAAFIAVPVVAFICLFIMIDYINNKKFNEYKLSKNVHTIFIGDSHVQQSVNDKIVANSINISQNSEAYYFTYYKLLTLLKNNPSVTRVYLGFSYHNLSGYYDEFVFGKYSRDVSSRYFFILPYSEKNRFIKHNVKALPSYFKNIITLGLHNAITKTYKSSYLGNYQSNFKDTKAIKSSMDKRLIFQFYYNGILDSFSNNNLFYLTKIADLCKAEKVKLILLNTPLQTYYKNKIPQEYIKKYNDIVNTQKFQVMDLNNLTLDDSCFIPDGDHLSEKGAAIISKYLDSTETAHALNQ